METLKIYEIDYSVSPNGVNCFDVYSPTGEYMDSYDKLEDACLFAYDNEYNFNVYTLVQYHKGLILDLLDTRPTVSAY
jgi:hypothetical protein